MYQAVMSSWEGKAETGRGSRVEAGRRLEADTLELESRLPGSVTWASYLLSLFLISHHYKVGSVIWSLFSSLTEQVYSSRRRGRFLRSLYHSSRAFPWRQEGRRDWPLPLRQGSGLRRADPTQDWAGQGQSSFLLGQGRIAMGSYPGRADGAVDRDPALPLTDCV